MVFVTALFIARLYIILLSNCCAIPSETSCAFSSGFLISLTFSLTVDFLVPRIFAIFSLYFSISSPFLPMTIPGLDVKTVTTASFVGLSINILLTEAFFNSEDR